MPFTIEQYNKLKESIATGSATVHYGDKTVTYRSLTDMLKLLGIMEGELFPERKPCRRTFATTDRGYFKSTS